MNVLADSLKIVIAILIAFGFGWFVFYNDIKALKTDIRALKAYLRSTPVPDQCLPPGQQESSKSCYYSLLMTDPDPLDKKNGLFSAKIHPDVFKKNAEDCPMVNNTLLEEYRALEYDCPPLTLDFTKNSFFYPNTETIYTFHVDGDTSFITIGQEAKLENVPGSKHLRKYTP